MNNKDKYLVAATITYFALKQALKDIKTVISTYDKYGIISEHYDIEKIKFLYNNYKNSLAFIRKDLKSRYGFKKEAEYDLDFITSNDLLNKTLISGKVFYMNLLRGFDKNDSTVVYYQKEAGETLKKYFETLE